MSHEGLSRIKWAEAPGRCSHQALELGRLLNKKLNPKGSKLEPFRLTLSLLSMYAYNTTVKAKSDALSHIDTAPISSLFKHNPQRRYPMSQYPKIFESYSTERLAVVKSSSNGFVKTHTHGVVLSFIKHYPARPTAPLPPHISAPVLGRTSTVFTLGLQTQPISRIDVCRARYFTGPLIKLRGNRPRKEWI